MKDIFQWFNKLWFTDKQYEIYLCCYQYGNLPVSTIASKCSFKRTSCYEIIKTMIIAWYLQEHIVKGVKYYSVVDPEKLISKVRQQLIWFESVIPLLQNLPKYDLNVPGIVVYSWLSECIKMYDDMLDYQNWTIYSIVGSHIDNIKLDSHITQSFYQQRIKNNISQQILSSEDDVQKIWVVKNISEDLYYKKRIDRSILDFQCWIHIYWNDKIMITLFHSQDMTWVIIQNSYIFQTLTTIFNLMWSNL